MAKHRKRRKKLRRCMDCGDPPIEGKKLRTLVVQVDGKKVARFDLCRACCATRIVGVSVQPHKA